MDKCCAAAAPELKILWGFWWPEKNDLVVGIQPTGYFSQYQETVVARITMTGRGCLFGVGIRWFSVPEIWRLWILRNGLC